MDSFVLKYEGKNDNQLKQLKSIWSHRNVWWMSIDWFN